jgi:hypothetical protein
MRPFTHAQYTTDQSDLIITIDKITYLDPDSKYVKVKLTLSNKHSGDIYEMRKNYKLNLESIQHWKRIL